MDTQVNKNEIIVVIDGTWEENKEVVRKYRPHINPITFEENYGQSKSTNIGIYNATNKNILVVNDDNVFPKEWDKILLEGYNEETDIMTPNQVEPYDSMFKQFLKYDFGKNIETFDLKKFYELEPTMRQNKIDGTRFYLTLSDVKDKLSKSRWLG